MDTHPCILNKINSHCAHSLTLLHWGHSIVETLPRSFLVEVSRPQLVPLYDGGIHLIKIICLHADMQHLAWNIFERKLHVWQVALLECMKIVPKYKHKCPSNRCCCCFCCCTSKFLPSFGDLYLPNGCFWLSILILFIHGSWDGMIISILNIISVFQCAGL